MAVLDSDPRPLRSISINKVPVLLDPVVVTDEQLRRSKLIAEAPELRQRLIAAIAARDPNDQASRPQLVEQQIFNGFYGWNDKARLKEFQRADWRRRQEIIATFEDSCLRQLGRRLLAFYAHELLSDQERRQYAEWLHERWHASTDTEVEWMTIDKARQTISEMKVSTDYDPMMLREIEDFLAEIADVAGEGGRL